MLSKRIVVSLVLLPIGIFIILQGGILFKAFILLILGLASWEYVHMFRAGGYQPAGAFVIGGSLALGLGRAWNGFQSADWILAAIVLGTMAYFVIAYELGDQQAGTDFGITLGGVIYLGWIGSYLITLREVPDGAWWFFTALMSVMIADSAAYVAGHRFGRHKFSPRVSPNKTWEGYLGGIVGGTLGGLLLAWLFRWIAGPQITVSLLSGLVLGLLLSILSPLGDLGESMFKRQLGFKDTSNILPGHGGIFDRIDSWLWAAVLGYYIAIWMFIP